MIETGQNSIGGRVIYQAREKGTITGYNDHYVFVRYDGQSHSKATRREDLEELMGELTIHGVKKIEVLGLQRLAASKTWYREIVIHAFGTDQTHSVGFRVEPRKPRPQIRLYRRFPFHYAVPGKEPVNEPQPTPGPR